MKKINENMALVVDEVYREIYLFTNLKELEYILIDVSTGYDEDIHIQVFDEPKKLNRNTESYSELCILVEIGEITPAEKDKRWEQIKQKKEELRKLEQEKRDKETYERLKAKFGGK